MLEKGGEEKKKRERKEGKKERRRRRRKGLKNQVLLKFAQVFKDFQISKVSMSFFKPNIIS